MNAGRTPAHAERRPSTRTIARLAAAGLLLIALIVFIAQNDKSVRIHFLVWSVNTHAAWALLLAGVVGGLIVVLAPRLQRFL
jgi:uncharacterized integral membrane protein